MTAAIVYALAVWRLAHMLVREDGPLGVFTTLRERLSALEMQSDWWGARMLPFHCVSCASIWTAAVLLVAPTWLRTLLAGSAAAKLIEDYLYAEPEEAIPYASADQVAFDGLR